MKIDFSTIKFGKKGYKKNINQNDKMAPIKSQNVQFDGLSVLSSYNSPFYNKNILQNQTTDQRQKHKATLPTCTASIIKKAGSTLYAKHPYPDTISTLMNSNVSENRAFPSISFKGGLKTVANQGYTAYQTISDKNFERLKNKFEEALKSMPDSIKDHADMMLSLSKENILLTDFLIHNNNPKRAEDIINAISSVENEFQFKVAEKILNDASLSTNEAIMTNSSFLISSIQNQEQLKLAEKILENKELCSNIQEEDIISLGMMIQSLTSTGQRRLAEKIIDNENLYKNEDVMCFAEGIIKSANTPMKTKIAEKILDDKELYNNAMVIQNADGFIDEVTTEEQRNVVLKVLDSKELRNNEIAIGVLKRLTAASKTPKQAGIALKILDSAKIQTNKRLVQFAHIIVTFSRDPNKAKVINSILDDKSLWSDETLTKMLAQLMQLIRDEKKAKDINDILKIESLSVPQKLALIFQNNTTDIQVIESLKKKIGAEKFNNLDLDNTYAALLFADFFGVQNIEELSQTQKRELLNALTKSNAEGFDKTSEIQQYFPLLPKNKEEYCRLLPAIAGSIGISIKPLSNKEIEKFNNDIKNLAASVKEIPDDKFAGLEIRQEYSNEDFILDTLKITEGLDSEEKGKVFDYFGFRLKKNGVNKTGYTIANYPTNNNETPNTTEPKILNAIESLRSNIIKFNENNSIICNNNEVQNSLNEIIKALPELRTTIQRIQAGMQGTVGSHEFDVLKHSLKVMQKIVQNPDFTKLSDSDKKITLLASLLHDITKQEGNIDPIHPLESSLDAYFISKKFNLTKKEEDKFFTLIKHHEWLSFVNTANNQEELNERLKSTAYDLRYDNLFELSLIFTHADLKSIKNDGSFHDSKEGDARTDFNGITRSFGEAADYHAEKIRNYIYGLKATQPILPSVEFPKASKINETIKITNPDGSTDIKGIYKDKDGLIIIKFNEIQDWEKIGFPKGSISKGIKGTTKTGREYDTGNIKFINHGCNYADELIKFDTFRLPGSDAVISGTYNITPESSRKFYAQQGILFTTETKNIHAGGGSNYNSGKKKNVDDDIKKQYIFGGKKEGNRIFISNLIKKAANFNDEEYINFVKENEDKALGKITPESLRNTIIRALADLNLNSKNKEDDYNEILISNPAPPMAVFACTVDNEEKITNPIDFLNRNIITEGEEENMISEADKRTVKERTAFLREYALKKDLPFVILGD